MSEVLIGTNFGEGGEVTPSAADDLATAISSAAQGPKSASSDGESVTSHSIDDLIKADKYLTAKRRSAQRMGGIRFGQIRSSGSTGAT